VAAHGPCTAAVMPVIGFLNASSPERGAQHLGAWQSSRPGYLSSSPLTPAGQSGLHRPTSEGPSKRRGTAAFRRYRAVSVSGIGLQKCHSGPWSPRPLFGVSFLLDGWTRDRLPLPPAESGPIAAAKTVVLVRSPGNGPTNCAPATGTISEPCAIPSSASPLATTSAA
jgi:hypothetical protein